MTETGAAALTLARAERDEARLRLEKARTALTCINALVLHAEDDLQQAELRLVTARQKPNDRTVWPGEEGYEDAFDVCPEPTCPLYGKAVMADHRHLTAKPSSTTGDDRG